LTTPCKIIVVITLRRALRLLLNLFSFHTGGVTVLMADGAVRFLSQNIDAVTFRSLASRDSGDPIGEF